MPASSVWTTAPIRAVRQTTECRSPPCSRRGLASCLGLDQETSCASSQSSRMIWFRKGARNRTAFAGSFRFSQLLRLMLGITLLPRRSRCLIFSCFMIRLLSRSKPVGNNFGSGPT